MKSLHEGQQECTARHKIMAYNTLLCFMIFLKKKISRNAEFTHLE